MQQVNISCNIGTTRIQTHLTKTKEHVFLMNQSKLICKQIVTKIFSRVGNVPLHIGSRVTYRVPTIGNFMLHIGSRLLVTSCCI